jgi:hypothetical protein
MTFVSSTYPLFVMTHRSVFILTVTILLFASCGGNRQDGSGKEQTQKQNPDTTSTDKSNRSSAMESDSLAKPPESTREDDLVLDLGELRRASKPAYQTLEGDTLNFRIKIPEAWQVATAPPANDGYRLATGSSEADVRIYQEGTAGRPGGLASPDCQQQEPFQFQKQKGTKCIQAGAVYYYITQRQERLVFYVKATQSWQQRHQSQLDSIASSLAFDQEKPVS